MNSIKTLLAFLKVGIIGFGGGSALIPVIEKEVVEKTGSINPDDYIKHTIIANITPGTLPTKLAALSNMKLSIPAAYIYTLPGVIILILFLGLLSGIGSSAIHYIEYASVGISTFIIFLLAEYIIKVMKGGRDTSKFKSYLLIMIAAFLVTGGKEVRSLISMLTGIENEALLSPIMDIQTINLMIGAFFVILFLGSNKTMGKKVTAIIVTIIYIASVSDMSPFPDGWHVNNIIISVMIVITGFSIIIDVRQATRIKEEHDEDGESLKKILRNIIIFAAIPVILFIPALIILSFVNIDSGLGLGGFFLNSIISTVTSFGGGEAFISIAEGFFVEPGYMPANLYYSQVVSIANALPGPILVKIIAGVGFEFGVIQYGSALIGVLIATVGTAAAVGVSSIGALVVLIFFDKLKTSPRLAMIKSYILPVVCGMLISTSLAMVFEAQKIIKHSLGGMAVIPGTIGIIILFFVTLLLKEKTKLNDVIILLIIATITLILILIGVKII